MRVTRNLGLTSASTALVPVVAALALVLAGWGAGELVHPSLDYTDLRMLRWVAAHREQFVTGFARTMTELGSMAVVAPVCVVVVAVLYVRRRSLDAATVVVTISGAVLIPDSVKSLVNRPRPAIHHLVSFSSSSFPSGHATQAAAVLPVLAWVLASARARRAALAGAVVFAVAVGWSRAYLGVHNPSDVIGGWIIGGLWATTVLSWRAAIRRTRSAPGAAPGTSPRPAPGAPRRPWRAFPPAR
jgi:undecaprenyl-diphosphatase